MGGLILSLRKGTMIMYQMKNIYYQIIGCIFFVSFALPICFYFVISSILLNKSMNWAVSIIIGAVFLFLIFILNTCYYFKTKTNLLEKYKHIQSLTRLVVLSNYYIQKVSTKGKKKIIYFPKIFYKQDKRNSFITITIALAGSVNLQKCFLNFGESLELTLSSDLIEKNILPGYVEYKFAVGDLRIAIENVEPIDSKIPLMKGLEWNIVKTPHMLVVGGTGGGKTYFLFTLIIAFLKMKAELVILDPKAADLADLESLLPNVSCKPAGIEKQLRLAYEGMLKRYDYIKSLPNYETGKDYHYYGLKPVVIIFDEFVAYIDSLQKDQRDKAIKYITQIVLMGRQAGYFLVLSTQRPDAQFLSGNIRDQLGARVTLGSMSSDGYRMAFGNVDKLFKPIMDKGGTGYIFLDGYTRIPRGFSSPFIPEDYHFMNTIATCLAERT